MAINADDFRVRRGARVDLAKWPTSIRRLCNSKKAYATLQDRQVAQLSSLQERHYASNRDALLLSLIHI